MSNIRTYRVNHAMQMISIPLHSTTNSYHLGNNDEIVDAKGVVQQVTNYYPFGAPYADASATLNPSLQAYKYNGKEFDHMHGLNTYDYGASQYNPVTARWDRMDPLSEKYYSTSPYAYCVNNPVMFLDPDGRDPNGWTRVWGGARMIGGVVQVCGGITGGIATSWTGIGGVVGGVAVLHGLDDIQAGFRQVYSGENVNNFTTTTISNSAQSLGINPNTSETIAEYSDLGLSFVMSGSGLVKSFSKGQSYASFTISPKKIDYFFGKVVEGNEHNVRRSASLAKELSTLGIKTDKQLMSIFAKTAKNGIVVKTQTNKFGTTITKSIQYKGSETQTGFFYANGDLKSVPKVTTVITKLHK